MFFLIFLNCIDRDLRGYVVGKVKFARADTTERDAVQVILHSFIQAGKITAFKKLAVVLREPAAYDRSDCVDDVFAGQIICRRDLRLSCRLIMSLLLHYLVAITPELDSRKGMDRVVDTAVTGTKAAEHLTVGGVDDSVTFQCGNISLPKIDMILNRL